MGQIWNKKMVHANERYDYNTVVKLNKHNEVFLPTLLNKDEIIFLPGQIYNKNNMLRCKQCDTRLNAHREDVEHVIKCNFASCKSDGSCCAQIKTFYFYTCVNCTKKQYFLNSDKLIKIMY